MRLCDLDDCGSKHFCKGYCQKHYTRWRKYGDPLKTLINPPGSSQRRIDSEGYVWLPYKFDHPNSYKDGRILEHVFVMSEVLGRALYSRENVHHKNGVRSDNRPENLELWVKHQPAGQRPEDLVAWAREILERYDKGDI